MSSLRAPASGWRDARRKDTEGSALIVTLAFVAVLTLLLVAFLGRATLEQQISGASTEEMKADQVAKAGLDVVVADFRQEIAAGSTVTVNTTANPTWPGIYLPQSANTSVPARILTPTESSNLPNLIRRSMRGSDFVANEPSFFSQYAGFSTNNMASTSSSLDPAVNGRSISTTRWNKPQLIASTKMGSFVTPDWVLVTRNGPKVFTAWDSTVGNSNPANSNYVVGRYAYAVYDEGGLLDVNVAGHPSGTPTVSKTSATALADLTQIPGIPNQAAVDTFVKWRNASTAGTVYNSGNPGDPTTYFGSVINTTNSFFRVQPGDQTLLTRQDLINYINSGVSGITTDALPYLGTFTRQLNTPSFHPVLTNFKTVPVDPSTSSTARPKVGDSAVSADTSRGTVGKDTLFNPSLADVRFPTAATLPDGTKVTAGEPLLHKHFALSRLALLDPIANPSATATASDANLIYRYFGLSRTDATQPWTYNHGATNGSIFTLPELQAAIAAGTVPARDPDFFELLQATIALGSLGRDGGTPPNNGPAGNCMAFDQSVTLHILQIGANIIDQASASYYPIVIQTQVSVAGVSSIYPIYGAENLPYISKVDHFVCRDTPTTASGWYVFELWNPYQVSSSSGSTFPGKFQIVATPLTAGTTSAAYFQLDVTLSDGTKVGPTNGSTTVFDASNYLQFTATATDFSNPTILDPKTFTITGPSANLPTIALYDYDSNYNLISFAPRKWAGLNLGEAPFPAGASTDTVQIFPSPTVSFSLQYQAPGSSTWQTYDVLRNISSTDVIMGMDKDYAKLLTYFLPPSSLWTRFYWKCDPRTDRWSSTLAYTGRTDVLSHTMDYDPVNLGGGFTPDKCWPQQSSGFTPFLTGLFWPLSQNNQNGNYSYMDPDGIVRGGDDLYSSTTGDSSALYGFSMNMAESVSPYISRPIFLHRPFNSVAELGYVFRDVDWKSLDFWTSRSGDSALLDVFSAYEEPSVVAGKIDLNTRNAPVLQALLNGAYIDEKGSPGTTISTSEAASLANQLVSVTSKSPFHNKSDLVNRLMASQDDTVTNPNSTDTWGGLFSSTGLPQAQKVRIKTNRESALRSLSEATATRTWNLMIDIIAQSGRYTSSATSLQNFTVDGEKRYWLHVAIDRYTGKIVDEQLEPVYE